LQKRLQDIDNMAKKENPKTKNSVEKRKTIIVTDPKDKRLRAYNDSNELYKHSTNYRNVLLKNSISPIKNEIVLKDTKTLDKIH